MAQDTIDLNFQVIDLYKAIKSSIETFEEQALTKNITINVQDKVQASNVYCDLISLSVNVLNNVINNAIKFSFENGVIDIEFIKEDEKELTFSIRDHGIGMTKEFRDSLFSNSYHESTKGTSQERGSGFGLGIIKFYIDKFNGKLDISSVHESESEDHGTCIKITLPKGPKNES